MKSTSKSQLKAIASKLPLGNLPDMQEAHFKALEKRDKEKGREGIQDYINETMKPFLQQKKIYNV
jgi:hypothetical protein